MIKLISVTFLVGILIFCDLWTKSLVNTRLSLGESVVIIPNLLNLTNVHNYGFAFGILRDANEAVKVTLTALILLFLGLILFWIFVKETCRLKRASLLLIFSGGFGNLYDRFMYGYVRDFIDFHFNGYHWPAFNLADMYVCVGAGLFLLMDSFRKKTCEKF